MSKNSVLLSFNFKRSLTNQSCRSLMQSRVALRATTSSSDTFGLNGKVPLYDLGQPTGVDCKQNGTKTAPLWDPLLGLERKIRDLQTIHRTTLWPVLQIPLKPVQRLASHSYNPLEPTQENFMTKGVKGRAKVQERQQSDLLRVHVHQDVVRDFQQCRLRTMDLLVCRLELKV